jgi:hypothetical protein
MKPQPEPSNQEVLAGLVERVTYHNAENGFCVLRAKVRGHRDLVTLVGHAATIAAGEWITASGEWINDRTHGQQFKARFLRTSLPNSADGIERYLSSGMIRGVGPVYAKKLVRAFGEKVFDVIEATPDRLREVDGIGPVRAASILAAWAEQKAVREIMVFLHSHGVGTARAVRIFKTYGSDAIQVMTENPYRLVRDIRGIGFKTADAIAIKLGIEKMAMIRVRAGISYALTEAMDEGHCGLPTEELLPLVEKLLEVPQQLVQTALDLELQEGGGRRPSWTKALCISSRSTSRGADHRRAADAAGERHPALALDRSGQGAAVGRRAYQSCPRRKPGHCDPARTEVQSAGDDWRSWGGKNDHRQSHPAHPLGKGHYHSAMRTDGARGQAYDRSDRVRSQDHPSAVGGRSQVWRLQARRG